MLRRRDMISGLYLAAAGSFAAAQAPRRASWDYTPDPRLPNVLIIGDSISMGYTLAVRDLLRGKANVLRPMRPGGKAPANCFSTAVGLKELPGWLGQTKWTVIHFNWGLHDLCYRNPGAKTPGNRDKTHGRIEVPLPEYQANLEKLVSRLGQTGARLIWATTTKVPEGEVGRFAGDERKYNAAAAEVMARHGIATDDLYLLSTRLPDAQWLGPGNVHFKAEGYGRLAGQVASSIERYLPAAAAR